MYHVNGILAFISSNSFTRSQIKKALLSMEYRAPSGYVTQKSENKVDINNLKESKSEVFGCTAPFIYKKRNTDIFFHGSIYSPESFNLELNDITRDLGEVTDKLSKVDGSFSFVTIDNDKMICGRDLLGTKPLYISRNSKSVIVSSEPEAIISLGANNIEYFQPGEINKFTIKTKEVKRIPNKIKRNKQDINMDEASSKVLEMIEKSVQNRVKKYKKVAVASSGGVDSSLLTIITKKYTEVEIIPLSLEGSSDRILAKKLAERLDVNMCDMIIDNNKAQDRIVFIKKLLKTDNIMNLSIGLGINLLANITAESNIDILFLGQLAAEQFGGYARYPSILSEEGENELKESLKKDTLNAYRKDFPRDEKAYSPHVEASLPYAQIDLINYSLELPINLKINLSKDIRKVVLREAALKAGMPEDIAYRPKKAMQYSSGLQKFVKTWLKSQEINH